MAATNTPQPLHTQGHLWGPRRVALGVSIKELERLSGVNRSALSLAEQGRYIPSGKEYDAVERALRLVEKGGDRG